MSENRQSGWGQEIDNGFFDCSPDPKTGRDQHIYRDTNGIVVPSLTQILVMQGFVDFSMVKPEVVERKRKIGSAVHMAAEFIDSPKHGELDWDSVHEDCVMYTVAYEHCVEEMKLQPTLIEKASIVNINGMTFGCRLDRAGTFGNNLPAIWEIKTSAAKSSVCWRLQTAAQELAVNKSDKGPKHYRFAIQLRKDGTFKADPYDDAKDARYFLMQLSSVWLKLNNGYKMPGVPDFIPEEDDAE